MEKQLFVGNLLLKVTPSFSTLGDLRCSHTPVSLNLEAGLPIILEPTVCYKTSQRFPYTMTACSRKKSIYDVFIPAQPQPFTDPVTGLQGSGEKVERPFGAKPPLACPGQCSAAFLGT